MMQVKNRRGTPRGWRVMATICLYQDTRHERPLFWMRNILKIGYISRRKDGMSEYRINGYESVDRILSYVQPYVRFKKKQVNIARKLLKLLMEKDFALFTTRQKMHIADYICAIRKENYTSGARKYTEDQIRTILLG